jgi:hypothetical protein
MALFGGSKMRVAVLTDYGTGDNKKVREIRESNLLQDGHVFTADSFTESTSSWASCCLRIAYRYPPFPSAQQSVKFRQHYGLMATVGAPIFRNIASGHWPSRLLPAAIAGTQ